MALFRMFTNKKRQILVGIMDFCEICAVIENRLISQ